MNSVKKDISSWREKCFICSKNGGKFQTNIHIISSRLEFSSLNPEQIISETNLEELSFIETDGYFRNILIENTTVKLSNKPIFSFFLKTNGYESDLDKTTIRLKAFKFESVSSNFYLSNLLNKSKLIWDSSHFENLEAFQTFLVEGNLLINNSSFIFTNSPNQIKTTANQINFLITVF